MGRGRIPDGSDDPKAVQRCIRMYLDIARAQREHALMAASFLMLLRAGVDIEKLRGKPRAETLGDIEALKKIVDEKISSWLGDCESVWGYIDDVKDAMARGWEKTPPDCMYGEKDDEGVAYSDEEFWYFVETASMHDPRVRARIGELLAAKAAALEPEHAEPGPIL